MSREYTRDEVRNIFFMKIASAIEYWHNESREPTVKGKLEGLTHTILATLDGSTLELPGFIIAPLGHKEDIDYYKSQGKNYFVVNKETDVKCDIGGSLHEELFQQLKKHYTKKP